jgi:hypothetical protein
MRRARYTCCTQPPQREEHWPSPGPRASRLSRYRPEASLPLNFELPMLLTRYATRSRRLVPQLVNPQHTETRDQPDSIAIPADDRSVSHYTAAMGRFLEMGTT